MQPLIYADLRCLQQDEYRIRGIGHHVAALLRTRMQSACSGWKAIGLTDPRLPALPSDLASLVDDVTCSVNPCHNGTPAVFLDGTPMTHDTRFSLRFLNHPAFFRAAVLYDFIPLDWPGYLPTIAHRIDYLAKLARLRKFDWFFPISEYTAWRASELLGATRSRMSVTGAPVRRSVYELRQRLESESSPNGKEDLYFLVVLAPDPRKNPELAIKAVRHLNLVYGRRIALKIAGHYKDPYKRHLLGLACHAEGEGFLEFCPSVSDEELASLYFGATATIAPSHIEGFSLPVVEASVCGSPVIASTCAAHLELIERPEALFPSDNAAVLCERLDALLNSPALRDSLIASQAQLATKFHEDAVGQRFWIALEAAVEQPRSSAVVTKAKPRLAFLSPYPPDKSDAALYTAMAIRAGEGLFRADVYTDAPRPLTFDGSFRDGGCMSVAPLLSGRYDAIVSVAGGSSRCGRIFDLFEISGGPLIVNDSALTEIYFHQFGRDKFLELAAKRIGGSISKHEVDAWLEQCDTLSAGLAVERAAPLIVHTKTQQEMVKEDFGADAQLIPCCPTVFFDEEELTSAAKKTARERNGIPEGAFLLSTFAPFSRTHGTETCILAIELLRSWNVPAELYLIGDSETERENVSRISSLYNVAAHVHYGPKFAGAATCRDFLIASDAAIQLRTYAFGQSSAALINCISARLPAVTTADMASSCDAPAYVDAVPDRFSPLQVAEHLAQIWEARSTPQYYADSRAAYLETHSFKKYAKRLVETLGIA